MRIFNSTGSDPGFCMEISLQRYSYVNLKKKKKKTVSVDANNIKEKLH